VTPPIRVQRVADFVVLLLLGTDSSLWSWQCRACGLLARLETTHTAAQAAGLAHLATHTEAR
jgi:hypothetical protein